MGNYIFLDIDGVLNNQNSMLFYHGNLSSNDYFDRRSLHLLSKLCEFCDCKVILSSSWRRALNDDLTTKYLTTKYFDGSEEESKTAVMLRLLKENNISLIGKTDTEHHADGKWDRAGQIVRYIEKYLQPEDKFIIFDDEDIIDEGCDKYIDILTGHFIQTDFYTNGLDYEHIARAMKYFETGILSDFNESMLGHK